MLVHRGPASEVEEWIDLLKSVGGDVNEGIDDSLRPLNKAVVAIYTWREPLEALLRKGADPNRRALHFLAARKHVDTVHSGGAYTPLARREVLDILFKFGARPHLMSREHQAAFEKIKAALPAYELEIAEMLKKYVNR
jgi:hypothetical protein